MSDDNYVRAEEEPKVFKSLDKNQVDYAYD